MKNFFLLLFALVAIATNTKAATDYGFKMLHVSITSDNYESQSEGKAWSYDPSANVLHLKDGNIATTISSARIIQIDGDVNPTLTIQVDGNCILGGTFSTGLFFSGNGKHTICGNGTLTMNSSLVNPQCITTLSRTDKVSLTIKDVTININAWGQSPVGFLNNGFSEIVLDNCEMNIKTSYVAWYGGGGAKPVFKDCYLVDGHFDANGGVYDSDGKALEEVYIKRREYITEVKLSVDSPNAGEQLSSTVTAAGNDYEITSVEWQCLTDDFSSLYPSGYNVPDGYICNMGEVYSIVIIVKSKKEDVWFSAEQTKVTVNGEEPLLFPISSSNPTEMGIRFTFPELVGTRYDLWVGGVQVNDANKDDVLGNGKVMYAPTTKTLSLKNGASITGQGRANDATTGYGAGIYSEIDGLTIDVASGGVEVIGADDCHGIYLRGKTTIKGEGSLSGKGYIGVFMGSNSADLTVDGNVMLQAEGTTSSGLHGYARTFVGKANYYTTLTIKGTSKVLANGVLKSIGDWKDLVLEDNHAITSPTGAVWNADKHAVCDASGNPIAGEWVLITKVANPYDLNGDEKVSTADIQVIINEMKKPAASQDMKYDLNGDGKISTADIQVIINEMKK